MMIMKKYIGISIIAMGLGLTACDDFLDKLPDNRTEANTEEKIQKLLIAAYPTHDHMAFTEYASDNVDDMGENNPNTERFIDQLYNWEDLTETDNQDTESYWMDLYQCIETANMALEGIESMGGATTKTLKQAQAEALLCRAYAHFMLVNIDHGDTHDLKKWLIDHYGILIRDASNFRSLDNHCFRVTARTPEEDDRLVEALSVYLSSY